MTPNSRSARSSRTTVGVRSPSTSFFPTRAYTGVTSPSHRLESQGVSTGTGTMSPQDLAHLVPAGQVLRGL
ncbi:MAG: hypothetical protein ACOCVZ_04165, partial [Gemmatimonadota bacterium]